MSRPIDHIVLPSADLGQAAERFRDLGFQVGRRNRHPWGTENHIIQFPGAFLELIGLAEDYRPVGSEQDAYPFAGFLAAQACCPSSGMLVLRSTNAADDRDEFQRSGIGAGRMLHFSRNAAGPDGQTTTVAFSLAFAEAPTMPDLGFFVCQQHHPENFWNPSFQQHPNGATSILGITIAAEEPAASAGFLSAFSGQGALRSSPEELVVQTGGDTVEVLAPQAFASRYGGNPAINRSSPRLAAVRFGVPDPAETGRRLGDAGTLAAGRLIVAGREPEDPMLVFETSTHENASLGNG